MHRFKGAELLDKELIKTAIIKASKNKRNRKEVRKVLSDIDRHVDIIYDMLESKSYKPSPYRTFEITDGISGKRRTVSCPKFFPDQIMHWAAILACEHIFMRGMYHWVCGSIPGRGIHYGRKAVKKWMNADKRGTKYCAKLDISKFYPSIDHDALKAKLRKKIKGSRLLWLLDTIIDSTGKGLPIGNFTSQWLANYLLQDLDHKITEEMDPAHYIRYMDDMVLFGSNKKTMHRIVRRIAEELKPLGLKLKSNWQVFRTTYTDRYGNERGRDVDFMGFRFFRGRILIRKRICLRIKRLALKIGKTKSPSFKQAASMISYKGWLKYTDSSYFGDKYIKPIINETKLKGILRNENRKRSQNAGLCARTA